MQPPVLFVCYDVRILCNIYIVFTVNFIYLSYKFCLLFVVDKIQLRKTRTLHDEVVNQLRDIGRSAPNNRSKRYAYNTIIRLEKPCRQIPLIIEFGRDVQFVERAARR